METVPPTGQLRRDVGLFGALMLGLGSIVGTGVFVSIGVAAGITGPAVILALVIAALVATCNALNSAQLAARHPVSGGTYEYGYRLVSPVAGFSAGWMFVCAKSASAATAALGAAGYALHLFSVDAPRLPVAIALVLTVLLTLLVCLGMHRTNVVNIVIVSITLAALVVFVVMGTPLTMREGAANLSPFFVAGPGEHGAGGAVLHASALMFVAYTGYGRIATLGEEVRDPARSIPRAIILALVVSAALYVAVAVVAIGVAGAAGIGADHGAAAPLVVAAARLGEPIRILVAIGAVTAMLGVLLNLLLGVSRMLLAMGRRHDMPAALARLSGNRNTPVTAVVTTGVVILLLVLTGSVRATWSLSAFTVLVYYAITNLAALRLPRSERLYHPVFAWAGLVACLVLAFQVDRRTWFAGVLLLAVGLVWHALARRLAARRSAPPADAA